MERVIHTLTEDKDADVRAFFAEPQAYDSDGEPINDISVSFKWHSLSLFKRIFKFYISFFFLFIEPASLKASPTDELGKSVFLEHSFSELQYILHS